VCRNQCGETIRRFAVGVSPSSFDSLSSSGGITRVSFAARAAATSGFRIVLGCISPPVADGKIHPSASPAAVDPRDADTYRDHVLPRGRGAPRGSPPEPEGPASPAPAGAQHADDIALRVRCGSIEGQSLRFKSANTEVTSKRKSSIVDLVVRSFDRAVVATSSKSTNYCFELKPSDEQNRIEWGPFYVEGRFRIVDTISDARVASEKFRAFEVSR